MEEGLFHNPQFVNYINEWAVAAIGHSGKHSEVDHVDRRTRKKSKVCPNYNTIPCSSHQDVSSGASSIREGRGMPQSFVCDNEGKKVKKFRASSPASVIAALQEAQKKIGKKPITGSMIRKLEAGLYKGDKALRKGKFKKALKAYNKVKGGKKTPEFVKAKAEKRIEALKEAALTAVKEAQGLPGKKAKSKLKKLLKEFKDLEEAREAAKEALKEAK